MKPVWCCARAVGTGSRIERSDWTEVKESMPRVFLHVDVLSWLRGALRADVRQRERCIDHLRQFISVGEVPFKTTEGVNYGWRRSQLAGNKFYLWWAPCGVLRQITDRAYKNASFTCDLADVYVRDITYHDDTDVRVSPDTNNMQLWVELTSELLRELETPVQKPTRSGQRAGRGRFYHEVDSDEIRAVRQHTEALRPRKQLRSTVRAAERSAARLGSDVRIAGTLSSVRDDLAALLQRTDQILGLSVEPSPVPAPKTPLASTSALVSPAQTTLSDSYVGDPAPEPGRPLDESAPAVQLDVPLEVQDAVLYLYSAPTANAKFAKRVGVSPTTFSAWANGKQRIGTRYWNKILSVAEAVRPRPQPPAPPVVQPQIRDFSDKETARVDIQQLVRELSSSGVTRADLAQRLGVSVATFNAWASGKRQVADYYWPLIPIVAGSIRREQDEVRAFSQAMLTLLGKYGASLAKQIGMRESTVSDYWKYGKLPPRAKMRKIIQMADS